MCSSNADTIFDPSPELAQLFSIDIEWSEELQQSHIGRAPFVDPIPQVLLRKEGDDFTLSDKFTVYANEDHSHCLSICNTRELCRIVRFGDGRFIGNWLKVEVHGASDVNLQPNTTALDCCGGNHGGLTNQTKGVIH